MGLWKKSTTAEKGTSEVGQGAPRAPTDPKLPGIAGYQGLGLTKNAMPVNRFNFVRPDGKPE